MFKKVVENAETILSITFLREFIFIKFKIKLLGESKMKCFEIQNTHKLWVFQIGFMGIA